LVKSAIGAPEVLWRLPIRHGRDVVREDGAARLMPGHDARRAFANLCSASLIVGRNLRGGASRQKNFESKTISISDACAAVANQFVDRA
jgi:hypothetical protein